MCFKKWLWLLMAFISTENENCPVEAAGSHGDDPRYTTELADFLALSSEFFSGLYELDESNIDVQLTDTLMKQIDDQMEHYVYILKKAHGLLSDVKESRSRRGLPTGAFDSLTRDSVGVYMFNGFDELPSLDVKFPVDISLFEIKDGHSNGYAAVLEANSTYNAQISKASQLVVFRYVDSKYMEAFRTTVTNGHRLSIQIIDGITYLMVAEHVNNKQDGNGYDLNGTPVYKINIDGSLMPVQIINTTFQSDVLFWEDMNQVFLAVATEYTNTSGIISYAAQTPIYRWLGGHFDLVGHIPTSNAKRLVHFNIGSSSFIAVANHQNDRGESAIFSEVFKYNVHIEQFVSYQKLSTRAAVDIKYFSITTHTGADHFLVVANHYEKGLDGFIDYKTTSTLYKYVEDHFVPFQSFDLYAATEWLPMTGLNGEFMLLVNCLYEGVHIYQYDGWRFTQSHVQFTGGAFGKGIMSLRGYVFGDQPVVVVANKNQHPSLKNIFAPVFSLKNELSTMHDDFMTWCQSSINELKAIDIDTIVEQVQRAPKVTSSTLNIDGRLEFSDALVHNLKASSIKTNNVLIDDFVIQNLNALNERISAHSNKITAVRNTIDSSLKNYDNVFIAGSINVSRMETSCISECKISNLNIESLNEHPVHEIYNDGHLNNRVEYDELVIDGKLAVENINGYPVETLVRKSGTVDLSNLIINGNITYHKGLTVDGLFDGIAFNKNNILLKTGDQLLSNDLKVTNLISNELSTVKINNMEFNQIPHILHNMNILTIGRNLTKLTVDNLNINNLLNGIHFETLYEKTLKATGDQIMSSNVVLNKVGALNLVTDAISGVNVDKFVQIVNGDFKITNDVEFTQMLFAKEILIKERLNNIPIVKGKLQAILKNSSEMQHIVGKKVFELVELSGPLVLQGKINSPSMDRMNPVTMIDEDLVLEGDYVISGNVTLQRSLRSNDIIAKHGIDAAGVTTNSFLKLQEFGLRLNETSIIGHAVFTQPIKADDIFVDNINSLDPDNWVLIDTDVPQKVNGLKTFHSDLEVAGTCIVIGRVNGVDLMALNDSVLKTHGDQTIEGRIYFDKVIAHRISTNYTKMHGTPFENILTFSGDQEITGSMNVTGKVLITEDLEVKHFKQHEDCEFVQFLTNMISDSMLSDGKVYNIRGDKYFHDLTIDNLYLGGYFGGLNIGNISHHVNKYSKDVYVTGPITFNNELSVFKIKYEHEIDSIPKEDFGYSWLLYESDQIITAPQYFTNVKCQEPVESENFNGINLNWLNEQIIWTNKEQTLGDVEFADGLVSHKPVIVSGLMSGIPFAEEVVLSKSTNRQMISGLKKINADMIVDGSLEINGLLNGIDFTELCHFAIPPPNEELPNLIIEGNVSFQKEPTVTFLHGLNLEEFSKMTWYINEDTIISDFMQFNVINLESEVIAEAFIDGVDLIWLSESYFSLTKDQNVSSSVDFAGGVIFRKNLISPEASIGGLISDINLELFKSTRLLNTGDQVLSGSVDFEQVLLINDFNSGLINKRNLSTSFMRYDVFENFVSGEKIIENLKVKDLYTKPGIQIQGVDVDWWMSNAVLRDGTFLVKGIKTFNAANISEDLSVDGLVNGFKFTSNNLLLKTGDQFITAEKTFDIKSSENSLKQSMTFNLLKTEGLNGVNFDLFINNIALRSSDLHLNGYNNFSNALMVRNADIKGLIYGVDLKELEDEVNKAGRYTDYDLEYSELLRNADIISDSLKSPAYFLSHYQVIQTIESVAISPVNLDTYLEHIPGATQSHSPHLASLLRYSLENRVDFLKWNDAEELFVLDQDYHLSTPASISYMNSVHLKHQEQLYIESEIMSPSEDFTHTGSLFSPNNKIYGQLTERFVISSNSTKSIVSLNFHQRDCFFVLMKLHSEVICKPVDNEQEEMVVVQTMDIQDAVQATSVTISNTPYIIILSTSVYQGSDHGSVVIYQCSEDSIGEVKCVHLQTIHGTNSGGLAAIRHNDEYYFATCSGHVEHAMHLGLVVVFRYDPFDNVFTHWQSIETKAPIRIRFAVLPTTELVLYVLTDSPTEPLIVYMYQGVMGFLEQVTASTIPKGTQLTSVNVDDKHFVIVTTENNRAVVIQAKFKGYLNK